MGKPCHLQELWSRQCIKLSNAVSKYNSKYYTFLHPAACNSLKLEKLAGAKKTRSKEEKKTWPYFQEEKLC